MFVRRPDLRAMLTGDGIFAALSEQVFSNTEFNTGTWESAPLIDQTVLINERGTAVFGFVIHFSVWVGSE
jgi:hypothetical protein